VESTETLTAAELSTKRLDDAAKERERNAGKPGYSVTGVKLRISSHGNYYSTDAAYERSLEIIADRKKASREKQRERNRARAKVKAADRTKARKGLPYFIRDREEMAEKDEVQRAKIGAQGVMKSPEEIQQLLIDLQCDPIARMAAIAERAEKAGELNTAANLYKELAQYAAPKRKAAEPKVIKDKNLTIMSEEELLAEIARLESI
jgi:hypothetical protein